MARKAKRGFKAPKNFDPNRGKKLKKKGKKYAAGSQHTDSKRAAGRKQTSGGYKRQGRAEDKSYQQKRDQHSSNRVDGKRSDLSDFEAGFAAGMRKAREELYAQELAAKYDKYSTKAGTRVHVFSDKQTRPESSKASSKAHNNAQEQTLKSAKRADYSGKDNNRTKTAQKHTKTGVTGVNTRERRDFSEQRAQNYQPPVDVVLERLEAKQTSAEEVADLTFEDLGLGRQITETLKAMGAQAPFAIQAATIPDVLAGKHVLGRGRTGSGKTIAFGASLIERLLELKRQGLFANDPKPPRRERGKRAEFVQGRRPKALIMAPTRELALQIDKTVQPLAKAAGFFTTQIVGGAPIGRQQHALKRGVDIVIGTPGRVEDLIERGDLDIKQVAIAVLDEADHMAELGFIEPVQRIWRGTRPDAQRLLFSATLDAQVAQLIAEFLREPAVHEVVDNKQGNIAHYTFVVMREDKSQVLTQIMQETAGSIVVFTRTRAFAETVRELAEDAGINAVDLHGNLSQARRERNLRRFTEGKVRVLVATDVAARGIHVDNVSLVLQADAPDDYKSYLHRAGRTGRAGNDGTVVTIVPRNRQKRARQLFTNAQLTPEYFGDFYPGDSLPW